MKASLSILFAGALLVVPSVRAQQVLAPQPGTPLRQTILDDLRNAEPTASLQKEKKQKIAFEKVTVRVSGDWAWVSVQPKTEDNKWHSEPISGLMRHVGGHWKVVEYVDEKVASAGNPGAAYTTWREAVLKKNPDCPALVIPRKG